MSKYDRLNNNAASRIIKERNKMLRILRNPALEAIERNQAIMDQIAYAKQLSFGSLNYNEASNGLQGSIHYYTKMYNQTNDMLTLYRDNVNRVFGSMNAEVLSVGINNPANVIYNNLNRIFTLTDEILGKIQSDQINSIEISDIESFNDSIESLSNEIDINSYNVEVEEESTDIVQNGVSTPSEDKKIDISKLLASIYYFLLIINLLFSDDFANTIDNIKGLVSDSLSASVQENKANSIDDLDNNVKNILNNLENINNNIVINEKEEN